jgi:uncharacterized protein (DUF2225 family)
VTLPRRQRCTCQLCGEGFTADLLGSTNSFGAVDADLREHPIGDDPVKYLIACCPRCGYTAYDHEEVLSPRERATVGAYLRSLPRTDYGSPRHPPSNRYALLVNILRLRGAPAGAVALAALRGAWMADDEGNEKRANEMRRESIHWHRKALREGEIPADEAPRAAYLVAELSRRVGDFDAAARWFASVNAAAGSGLAELATAQAARARARDSSAARIREEIDLFGPR